MRSLLVLATSTNALFLNRQQDPAGSAAPVADYGDINEEKALPAEVQPSEGANWENTLERKLEVGYSANPERIDDELENSVTCDDDSVTRTRKYIFAVSMGCNRQWVHGGDAKNPLCANFKKGGCDNEECHQNCLAYSRTEASCRCNSWTAAGADGAASKEPVTFQAFSPGAPCPRSTPQPRCYQGKMHFSECFAKNAPGAEDVSVSDMEALPESAWPTKDGESFRGEFALDSNSWGSNGFEGAFPC